MNFYVLTEEQFQAITNQLERIQRTLDNPNQEEYFDNADLLQHLKISQRTLSTWRESGIIAYSKIGGKLFYSKEDVREVMEKHHREAFRNR